MRGEIKNPYGRLTDRIGALTRYYIATSLDSNNLNELMFLTDYAMHFYYDKSLVTGLGYHNTKKGVKSNKLFYVLIDCADKGYVACSNNHFFSRSLSVKPNNKFSFEDAEKKLKLKGYPLSYLNMVKLAFFHGSSLGQMCRILDKSLKNLS